MDICFSYAVVVVANMIGYIFVLVIDVTLCAFVIISVNIIVLNIWVIVAYYVRVIV